MAYMFIIQSQCNKDGCRKQATHRVCNCRNDTMGNYCSKHAAERVDDLNITERLTRKLAQSDPAVAGTD